MNTLLLNPPFYKNFSRGQRSPAVIKSGTLYYPFWLSFAAGVMENGGHQVCLLDAVAHNLDCKKILTVVRKFSPHLVVLETSTASINNDLDVADLIREVFPHVFISLVGTHPSVLSNEILQQFPQVNAIARKEYDYTLLDLANKLEADESLSRVAGLSFRNSDGEIIHNPDRPFIEDLDALPFLSRIYKKHLPIKNYYFSLAGHPMIMLITGRGCPNGCFFCVFPQTLHGRRYRCRSAENVVEELVYIQRELPEIREIVFEDDTFTADRDRIHRICELILKKRLAFRWFANVRVNIDYETLRLMKRAGFRCCAVGFESGNQKLLNAMHKGISLEQSRRFAKNIHRLGIILHGCFMVGFPGETKKTMEQTFLLAEELKCDSAQFYPIFLYPGTEAFRWAKDKGYLYTQDYNQWLTSSGGHNCVFDLPDLSSKHMMDFCEDAYRRYHLNKKYLSRKLIQMVTNPREGRRTFRAGMNYFQYLWKKHFRSEHEYIHCSRVL